jgi:2-polyprenyl-3-methyl-5-hydroxy-6-metoxy-1,4-benzoquinol methylase
MPRYATARLARCRRCTFVFASVAPSAAELSAYYAAYPPAAAVSELTMRRYDELLDRLAPFRQTGRLHDFGCGDGHFLMRARECGWESSGSEYGEAPRLRALERGLDVRPAPFTATRDEEASFDVVTAFEVLEHVAEPLAEVQRMAGLLRPGGCCYVTVPNFASLSRRISGPRWRPVEYPEHLSYFTPRTLDRLLQMAGLSPLKVRTTGASVATVRQAVRDAAGGQGADAGDDRIEIDRHVRTRIETSRALETGVRGMNVALSLLGVGDTIKALYRR